MPRHCKTLFMFAGVTCVSGRRRAGAHAGVGVLGGVLLLERRGPQNRDFDAESVRGHDRHIWSQPIQSGKTAFFFLSFFEFFCYCFFAFLLAFFFFGFLVFALRE